MYKKQEQAEAIESLKTFIKPGMKIFTILRSVATTGMSRKLSFVIPVDGEIRDITYTVAQALGYKPVDVDGHRAIKVNGSGMDMGYHAVYTLGACLWPRGTPEPHSTRNGQPDSVGGYALKHGWL